jgi:hypothetical protein
MLLYRKIKDVRRGPDMKTTKRSFVLQERVSMMQRAMMNSF